MPSPRTLPSLPSATVLELTDSMIVQQANVTRRMSISLLKERVEVDNTLAINSLTATVNAALTAQNATFNSRITAVNQARDQALTAIDSAQGSTISAIQALAITKPAVFIRITGNTMLVPGYVYALDAATGTPVELTLPAVPALGDAVIFIDFETVGFATEYVVKRNGKTIMGKDEDLTIDTPGIAFTLRWSGSDWRLF